MGVMKNYKGDMISLRHGNFFKSMGNLEATLEVSAAL